MQSTVMLRELMRFNVGYLKRLLEDIPPDSFFVRPEGKGNPLIWLLGHVVLNRGEIIELLGGDAVTRDLGDLFARGTVPQSDRSIYPRPARLVSRFVSLSKLTDHLLGSCDDKLLNRPSWGQFEMLGQNLAFSYMHETHHIGQIAYIANLPGIKAARKGTSFARPQKKNSTGKILLENLKSVFG